MNHNEKTNRITFKQKHYWKCQNLGTVFVLKMLEKTGPDKILKSRLICLEILNRISISIHKHEIETWYFPIQPWVCLLSLVYRTPHLSGTLNRSEDLSEEIEFSHILHTRKVRKSICSVGANYDPYFSHKNNAMQELDDFGCSKYDLKF